MFSRKIRSRLIAATAISFLSQSLFAAHAGVWVNEFHYDNASTDQGEFFELAGTAGTDLSGWTLELHNGSNGSVYNTISLSGILGDEVNGFGFATVDLPTNGIQNGGPDGFALVDNNGSVVEFLSYEGSFTTNQGAAAGMTSTDIGVRESGGTPVGQSLQRVGDGDSAASFTWAAPQANTKGAANTGQTFNGQGNGGNPGGDPGNGGNPGSGAPAVAIYDIQGAGHSSTFEGQTVETMGVVTGLTDDGFYIQDVNGDGNNATSDAIYVEFGSQPTVSVGDAVTVTGEIEEAFGSSTRLSVTRFSEDNLNVVVDSSNNAVPAAVVIGAGGRAVPTSVIEDDGLSSFDPATDGLDFYESLEGMLVELPNATTVDHKNRFGEIYAVGAGATGVNAQGGVTLTENDANPERIQIQANGDFGAVADTEVGDGLGTITGNLDYNFGDYEIVVNSDVNVQSAANNIGEVTQLTSNADSVTVATFNALLQDNFNQPTQSQIEGIAAQIVNNLQSPDIVGLQEVQTAFANGGAQALLDAIVAAGGPQYQLAFVDGNSEFNSSSIQTAFLYAPGVDLVSVELLPNGVPDSNSHPFDGGQRVPLVGTFEVNGETFTVVNNHFDSKNGSSPAFGSAQPPINGGEADRIAQAQLVNDFVDGFLAANPDANILVLGDLNEFSWETALRDILSGADGALVNLEFLISDLTDRFTFNFEGNAQALDHIFANLNILENFNLELDFVHINALFSNGASDHDPILLRISGLGGAPVPVPGALIFMLSSLAAWFGMRRRAA